MAKIIYPWAKPALWGNESEYVLKAIASTWISGGPYVEQLENRVAKLCGVPFAAAVANGTAAVHLAYLGLDLKLGDEVVVPGFGFQAAANLALLMHLKPVFAEVDPRTWCVTAATIEPCLTPRTRAIVAVHTYGNVCPMDEINELARRHNLPVIEDVAEAFGSVYHGRAAGSLGTLGCFSFQATKTITTGEGGMVVTADAQLYRKMLLYRSHGMDRKRYWHEVPGHNFRLTNFQAAMGCAQLDALETIVAMRRRMHAAYRRHLEGQEGIALQVWTDGVEPLLWALAGRLDPLHFPQGRDRVMQQLLEEGIETRPGFYPPSAQPIYRTGPLPVSEKVSAEMISLPSYPALQDGEIAGICDRLKRLRQPTRSAVAA